MSVSELIKFLQALQKVHPEAEVVEARTILGRPSHQIDVRVRDHVVVIQGGHV